ncbi:MAG TPA: hypothetical protein DHV28_03555 [Ignavibacteriales bacterium]|nr:hypothetical protein [Ignavibacteriales bacterium]
MASIIDILGSSFIGGLLLLLLLKLNLFANSSGVTSDNELKLQQNAKTLAEIVNYDFRKIGYQCDSTAIAIADSDHIKFYADLDRNNTVDVLEYYTSDTTVATGTDNPRDIILYRKFNGVAMGGPTLGLTKIKFTYLDQYNIVTTVLPNIKYVKVELWVESTIPEMESNFVNPNHPYLFTYWEMKINPRNI